MLVSQKTSIRFSVELRQLSLREISDVMSVNALIFLCALMTRKSCTVGMSNAILRNHLNKD